ncbi:MAG TPA: hypothetical protein VHL58_06675, partial [Thermoanaerobaculia bacterium]|nr:hypothetical protein [Thermoanaerobaculia bacterium]
PTGVDLPIVREDQFFTKASTFLGIPVGATVRSALRVYDPRLQKGSTVRVDVLAEDGRVLATRRLFPGNNTIAQAQDPTFQQVAGYDAILDLRRSFPELDEVARYHLRVTPETPGMEYWAFVSVTDNESQHVLLITSK